MLIENKEVVVVLEKNVLGKNVLENKVLEKNALEQTNESATIINIRSARKAQEKASAELMDYMVWTMKHDMDPHRLYDDPIAVFREELRATQFVA